jgi:DNA-binding transcriptional LysR family regulator
MPEILMLMRKEHPQIEVSVMGGNSVDLYPKVVSGDLDGAIIIQPPFALPKICDWRVLREEPLVVLTPAAMPARHPHTILASEPFIRFDRSTWTGRLVDGYLRRAAIRPREQFELVNFEAMARMVDRGLGVTLVPDWSPPWPEGLSLRKLPVPDSSFASSFARRIGLIWTRASVRLRVPCHLAMSPTRRPVPWPNSAKAPLGQYGSYQGISCRSRLSGGPASIRRHALCFR